MATDEPQGRACLGCSGAQRLHLALSLQFADGVYLVLLMGLLEGYFVPLHSFFLTPDSFEQKVRGGDITGGPEPHGPPSSAHTLLGPCREKAVASRLPRALGSDQQLTWALQTLKHPQRLSLPLLSGPGTLAPAGRTAQPPLPPQT